MISALSDRISQRVQERNEFLKRAAEELRAGDYAAMGTGVGTAAGLGKSVIQGLPAFKEIAALETRMPALLAQRKEVMNYLDLVRESQGISKQQIPDRKLSGILLGAEKVPENYYFLRRGTEEGFAGVSRSRKLLKLLKRRLKSQALKNTLIGAGVGLGGGLLAATAAERFDRRSVKPD